ncbi:N-formylglutamate deformylase [Pinirhizobacter sp.]|jgi:N-formylglutamate deformylase|uniref:N-formylglutamate deformylase n=1 Tax=Pinirhizobacter sp. TaxID=2950432 RepID=UPI002F416439
METFQLHRGTAPLLVSLPHNGSFIPVDITERMHPLAQVSPDSDWHVDLLYDFAIGLGASVIKPLASRYVVDLNRPADGHALYPGRTETGLVPTMMFDGAPIYRDGEAVGPDETAARVNQYWRPYHTALASEIARMRDVHERIVLWEGHSIRAVVPMLFEGRLPDLNLGTADGVSCDPSLQASLATQLEGQDRYTHVVNGRFKGGYITRAYGNPGQGVHAVQLELAQVNYMDEKTFAYDEIKAAGLKKILHPLLQACIGFAQAAAGASQ